MGKFFFCFVNGYAREIGHERVRLNVTEAEIEAAGGIKAALDAKYGYDVCDVVAVADEEKSIRQFYRTSERGYPLISAAWVEFVEWDGGRAVRLLAQTPVHSGPEPSVPAREIAVARLEAERQLVA